MLKNPRKKSQIRVHTQMTSQIYPSLPRTNAHLGVKFGEDYCRTVTSLAGTDKSTNKRTNTTDQPAGRNFHFPKFRSAIMNNLPQTCSLTNLQSRTQIFSTSRGHADDTSVLFCSSDGKPSSTHCNTLQSDSCNTVCTIHNDKPHMSLHRAY